MHILKFNFSVAKYRKSFVVIGFNVEFNWDADFSNSDCYRRSFHNLIMNFNGKTYSPKSEYKKYKLLRMLKYFKTNAWRGIVCESCHFFQRLKQTDEKQLKRSEFMQSVESEKEL